jgi:uncharacterized protein YaaR (DUF327 family)
MSGSRTEKQILLQRITALERLAKIGTLTYNGPSIEEIEAWSAELKEYVKRAVKEER